MQVLEKNHSNARCLLRARTEARPAHTHSLAWERPQPTGSSECGQDHTQQCGQRQERFTLSPRHASALLFCFETAFHHPQDLPRLGSPEHPPGGTRQRVPHRTAPRPQRTGAARPAPRPGRGRDRPRSAAVGPWEPPGEAAIPARSRGPALAPAGQAARRPPRPARDSAARPGPLPQTPRVRRGRRRSDGASASPAARPGPARRGPRTRCPPRTHFSPPPPPPASSLPAPPPWLLLWPLSAGGSPVVGDGACAPFPGSSKAPSERVHKPRAEGGSAGNPGPRREAGGLEPKAASGGGRRLQPAAGPGPPPPAAPGGPSSSSSRSSAERHSRIMLRHFPPPSAPARRPAAPLAPRRARPRSPDWRRPRNCQAGGTLIGQQGRHSGCATPSRRGTSRPAGR